MKQKMMAILAVLALILGLTACGNKETTVTGMIVAVDGSTISVVEMSEDMQEMGGRGFGGGERPEMPEGVENFEGMEGFENFNPEDFENMNPEDFADRMPEGVEMPQWGEGEGPEMPEDGEMPNFDGGRMPGGDFAEDMETTDFDISKARISVEFDGGKESGTVDDLQPGATVTVTANKKGEASYVLVSSQSFFGGGFMFGNRMS